MFSFFVAIGRSPNYMFKQLFSIFAAVFTAHCSFETPHSLNRCYPSFTKKKYTCPFQSTHLLSTLPRVLHFPFPHSIEVHTHTHVSMHFFSPMLFNKHQCGTHQLHPLSHTCACSHLYANTHVVGSHPHPQQLYI